MAKYYIIVTTEIDYEWDIDNEFKCIGLPKRLKNTLEKMEKGDKIIFYVTKCSKFMAVVQVVGKYFYSDERIWDDDFNLWPCRITTQPITYIQECENGIYIKDIWDNLDLIDNKQRWGIKFQGSMKSITEHDYKVISESILKQASVIRPGV